MSTLKISVVIPAFNVEQFLATAVDSVLAQEAVQEIMIVEDGSTDGTWALCHRLKDQHSSRIRLLQHPGGHNKGASASRNLGIKQARGDFIAFLDADDCYLSNRFNSEQSLFQDPEVDGVYGAVEAKFMTALGEERFNKARMRRLTTVTGQPRPAALLDVLLGGHPTCSGHIHLNALTVRRSLFDQAGLFDESLEYGEDTDLIIRMATMGRLVSGMTDQPVAIRGVHDDNRITNIKKRNKSWTALYQKLYEWGSDHGMPDRALAICRRKALLRYPYTISVMEGFRFVRSLPQEHPDLHDDPEAYYDIVMAVFRDSLFGRVYLKVEKMIRSLLQSKTNSSDA